MRILRLDLIAFGPFDAVSIDLSPGEHGLHVIHGPNEAGKSSALRALRQLLYGIESQTPDNFRHPYDRLRIGAKLRHSDGSELEFTRLKRMKNSLRTPDGEAPLDPGLMERFLGGVSEETFKQRFGIDHAALIQGGADILKTDGELGQLLFAAGSGLSALQGVRTRLGNEADALFKERGRNQLIPDLLRQLDEARTQVRNAQLPLAEWQQHESDLQAARDRKANLERERQQQDRERRRLSRLHDALPTITRRTELLAELESLRGTPDLPADFGERCRKAREAFHLAESQAKLAQEALDVVRPQLDSLVVPEALLARADAIDDLHRRLGEYEKGLRDRPQRELQQKTLLHQAKEILRALGRAAEIEQAEGLRLQTNEPQRIRTLGIRSGTLGTRHENAVKICEELTVQLQQTRAARAGLDEVREVGALRQTVERALQAGPLEDDLARDREKLRRLQNQVEQMLAQMPSWSGSLDELVRLAVPPLETLDRFRAELDEARLQRQDLRKQAEETEFRRRDEEGQLRALQLQQEVPTEAELYDARRRREAGWQLVRRAWLEGRTDPGQAGLFAAGAESAPRLADAFERSVASADEVVDRLRRDAERVARKADLLARQERLAEQQCQHAGLLLAAEARQQRLQDQWAECGRSHRLPGYPPGELKAWLDRRSELVRAAAELEELSEALATRERLLEGCRAELESELRWLGLEPGRDTRLSALLAQSRGVVTKTEENARRHAQLAEAERETVRKLGQAEVELRQAKAALDEWRTQWRESVERLGLKGDTLPDEANAVLEEIVKLFQKLTEADGFRRRIEGLDRDLDLFQRDAGDLAKEIAPDLESGQPDRMVRALLQALHEARAAEQQRKELRKRRAEEKEKLRSAAAEQASAKARLDTLCEQGRCQRYSELQGVGDQAERRRLCVGELRQSEAQLLPLRGGMPLDEFVAAAKAADPDLLESSIQQLDRALADVDARVGEVHQTIGGEEKELARMDGRATAAEAADRAEQIVARLQGHVEDYVAARMAAAVLQRAIDQYREKNQGPVLARAGQLLERLTDGSFAGLRIEGNDTGKAFLAVVRPNQEVVGVAGLSDGSRDQLYLALRLASLRVYLEQHEAMPFIVDDILLNFDDTRAAATLAVLAELATQTQVLFFTHHEHLVELARRHVGSDQLIVHRLLGRTERSPEARG